VNSRNGSGPSGRMLGGRVASHGALEEMAFHRMMSLERRRTGRSRKSFLLMLLDIGDQTFARHNRHMHKKILAALAMILRETDVTGWYKEGSVIGVMFTEITFDDPASIPASLIARVTETLKQQLTPQQLHQIGVSYHLMPGTREPEYAAHVAHAGVLPVAAPNSAETSV
jgi:hypothetical protein